jgi:hypothetical protein
MIIAQTKNPGHPNAKYMVSPRANAMHTIMPDVCGSFIIDIALLEMINNSVRPKAYAKVPFSAINIIP